MRNRVIILTTLLTAGSMIAGLAPFNRQAVIPFDFFVGKAMLPAGRYQVSTDAGTGLVRVQGLSNGMIATATSFATEHRDGSRQSSRLMFNRYGTVYFLSGLCCELIDSGRTLLRSREERELSTKTPARSETLELKQNDID